MICRKCMQDFNQSRLTLLNGIPYCDRCIDRVHEITKKDSNPKQVYGDTKVGLGSLPFGPIYAMAIAMMEGGLKYGKHNYREMGCKHSTYFDAAVGHLVSWHEGEDLDEDSGLHHLMKAAACCLVMYDSILMKNDTDDRPIRYPEGVPLRINPMVGKLLKKYPDPVPPFIEKDTVPEPAIDGRQGEANRRKSGQVGRRNHQTGRYPDRRDGSARRKQSTSDRRSQ